MIKKNSNNNNDNNNNNNNILMFKETYNRCISSMLNQWLLPKHIDIITGTQFYRRPNLVLYSDSRM
jgi:hypothetical protein